MAKPLQNRALFKKIHIALFFFVIFIAKSSYAQTLLLPGDIVFISVNATNDSFEILPLIDLEEGTEFIISNGEWSNSEEDFLDSEEVKFTAKKNIVAGIPLKVSSNGTSDFTIDGKVELSSEQEVLFIYQQDEIKKRFIFALGWGEKQSRRDRSFFGSDVPVALNSDTKYTLRLGNFDNYQYYIRNGASGTSKMLQGFITNAAYWRGENGNGFSEIGTSFNLLNAPVILFDESISSVKEGDKKISLNVAIYEHDGSKLTVDVVFDSLYSSAERSEFEGFKSQRINFTGLIGDAVYEIEVPLNNDKIFEGTETGIFTLQNLSKGKFGDFISHTVLLMDDESPELKLEVTANYDENILLIHNLESNEVDLGNWELEKGDSKINFVKNTTIGVGESLILIEYRENLSDEVLNSSYLLDSDEASILNSDGVIQLKNYEGKKIAELKVSQREEITSKALAESNSNSNEATNTSVSNIEVSNTNSDVSTPGWKVNLSGEIDVDDYAGSTFYFWNEPDKKFQQISTDNASIPENALLVAYFDEESAAKLDGSRQKSSVSEKFSLKLSATDNDNSGHINNLEGLNLIQNNSNVAITVNKLAKLIEGELELSKSIDVFKSNYAFSKINFLEKESLILPGDIIWIKLNSPLEEHELEFNLDGITLEPVIEEEIEKGVLELVVSGKGKSINFRLNFSNEDLSLDNRKSLKLYSEVYLNTFNEFILTGYSGENYYDIFEIDSELENITQIPLSFSSPVSGDFELKVENWTDIPEGWVIRVEDLKEERSYDIYENWSMNFSYTYSDEPQVNESKFSSIEERFVVKVIPESLVKGEEETGLPTTVELNQNYPNPFNPSTTISFYLPEEGNVKLSVFNIVGQPVAVLLQETMTKGEHTLDWDASDMPSGIYIYQLEVGTKIMTRKMTLVK